MPPDCATCDYPGLWPENLAAAQVLNACGTVLFDGLGGVNLANAREAATALGLAWDEGLARKIAAAAGLLLELAQDKNRD